MTKTFALLAVSLAAIAAPAHAGSQDDLRACKAQLIADGHVSEATKSVKTDKIRRSAITLEITEADGTKSDVTCRISRGVVMGFERDGRVLLAKTATPAATTGN